MDAENWSIAAIGPNIGQDIRITFNNKQVLKSSCKELVTAVNCTYGANINPDKIGELIHCVEMLLDQMHTERKTYAYSDNLEQALNNIKYK